MSTRIGAVELGGTKVNVAVGTPDGELLAQERIPTGAPAETLPAVLAWFAAQPPVAAFGIGSFGPVDIDPASPGFGRIMRTPKPGWSGVDVVEPFRGFGVPVALDTDVNAAALGEHRWGAAQGLDVAIYLTVGTGIGGGLVVDGRLVHGLLHPEMGHVALCREPGDDAPSTCPYHADCAEGLACGPAVVRRTGKQLGELAPDHPVHGLTARYLGQLCATLVLVAAPRRIVLGGGVASAPGLHARVAQDLRARLSGFLTAPPLADESFVCSPALGGNSGLLGALALACP